MNAEYATPASAPPLARDDSQPSDSGHWLNAANGPSRFARIGASVGLAVFATGGLGLLMQMLIANDTPPQVADAAPPNIVWVQPRDDEEPPSRPKKVEPPPKVEIPPVAPQVAVDPGNFGKEIKHTVGKRVSPVKFEPAAALDGALVSILVTEPVYPDRARSRGIEGWVIVQFTVDVTGAVIDPVVVEASPSNIFNQSALRAVLKSKYKPTVKDGKAMRTHNVRRRLVYRMEQA